MQDATIYFEPSLHHGVALIKVQVIFPFFSSFFSFFSGIFFKAMTKCSRIVHCKCSL